MFQLRALDGKCKNDKFNLVTAILVNIYCYFGMDSKSNLPRPNACENMSNHQDHNG